MSNPANAHSLHITDYYFSLLVQVDKKQTFSSIVLHLRHAATFSWFELGVKGHSSDFSLLSLFLGQFLIPWTADLETRWYKRFDSVTDLQCIVGCVDYGSLEEFPSGINSSLHAEKQRVVLFLDSRLHVRFIFRLRNDTAGRFGPVLPETWKK